MGSNPLPVVFNERHGAHAPPREFLQCELIPSLEKPERADLVMQALRSAPFPIKVMAPRPFDMSHIEAVHDREYLAYLRDVYAAVQETHGAAPEYGVFPDTMLHRAFEHAKYRKPASAAFCCGYFCYDMSTPVMEATYEAAILAAHVALTAADLLRGGARLAYALCRPPGHHAGRAFYGGYCYLNNAAAAAALLRDRGGPAGGPARVAILDIDFHHGNGTQEIFYGDGSVLYVSLHADPASDYPYYSGTAAEKGVGAGAGANLNLPLPAGTALPEYLAALQTALAAIARFGPAFLVVSAGFDTLAGDPICTFQLRPAEFGRIGAIIAAAVRVPTLVVHEGGYNVADMPAAAVNLLGALRDGLAD